MSAHALPSPGSGLRRLRPLARRTDDDLRALAASGDTGAFAELYERHHQALYRYCRSIVRHDEDARDALHSTWTNAWAALRTADRDVPVRPWLFRIAHNEAISVLRRRRDHDDLDEVAGAAAGGALEDDVAVRQRLATLRSDLAELPERQRSALLLRELSGLGHDEIAAVHGVTPAAAKQSIYEARRALQEAEEGRSMICTDVQRLLSDGDGRVRRGRKVRAHLRTCDVCAGFEAALTRRPADLALLAPPLPAAAAAGLLAQFLSHAGAHGSGGAAATAAGTSAAGFAGGTSGSVAAGSLASGAATSAGTAGGLVAAGSKLGLGLAAKVALGAVVVAGAGAGTVQVVDHVSGGSPAAPPAHTATVPGGQAGVAPGTTVAAGAAAGGSGSGTTAASARASRGTHGASATGHGNGGTATSRSGHGRGAATTGSAANGKGAGASHGSSGSAGSGKRDAATSHRKAVRHKAAKVKVKPTKPAHAPKTGRPIKTPAVTGSPSGSGSGTTTTHTTTKPAKPAPTTTSSDTSSTSGTPTDTGTTTSSSDSLSTQSGGSAASGIGRTSTVAATS